MSNLESATLHNPRIPRWYKMFLSETRQPENGRNKIHLNSLGLSDAIWRHWFGSTLVQVMMSQWWVRLMKPTAVGFISLTTVHVYVRLGVVSWGFGCARPFSYAIYTDVGFYRNWIDKTMAENWNILEDDGNDVTGMVEAGGRKRPWRQSSGFFCANIEPFTC